MIYCPLSKEECNDNCIFVHLFTDGSRQCDIYEFMKELLSAIRVLQGEYEP